MDTKSEGYYEGILEKAKPALDQIAKAIRKDANPDNYTIPLTSLIRRMQGDGADADCTKAYLTDAADIVCAKYTTQDDSMWMAMKRVINRNVDYQYSLSNGRSLHL